MKPIQLLSIAAVIIVPVSGAAVIALALGPKQANNDWCFRNGADRRLMARTAPPAVCDGFVALGFSFVMLSFRTCRGPTRAGTSLPRLHEANSTPQRPIHLPVYGVDAA